MGIISTNLNSKEGLQWSLLLEWSLEHKKCEIKANLVLQPVYVLGGECIWTSVLCNLFIGFLEFYATA